MKTCIKCGVSQNLGEFLRFSYTSDGMDDWCRRCEARRYEEICARGGTRRKNTVKVAFHAICAKCGATKSGDEFVSGCLCRACESARARLYQATHREQIAAVAAAEKDHNAAVERERYKRIKEQKNAVSRAWNAANKQRTVKYNKERRDSLVSGYVAGLMAARLQINPSQIPRALIDLKREHLRLVRLIREKQSESNNRSRTRRGARRSIHANQV